MLRMVSLPKRFRISEAEISVGDIASTISHLIKKEKVTIFFGAGISRESGIPLAHELKMAILNELQLDSKEKTNPYSSKLSLEILLDNISRFYDLDILLKVFQSKNPTKIHYAFASLVKEGYVSELITTNFDTLVEQAFEESGLISGKDYILLTRKNNMEKFPTTRGLNQPRLIKLHGSIDSPESIMMTLSDVSPYNSKKELRSILKHIFTSVRRRYILFLGYSFSDGYDINEIINEITVRKKNLIYISHENSGSKIKISNIKDSKFSREFPEIGGFNGWFINCNTQVLVEEILKELKLVPSPFYDKINFADEWREFVSDWGKITLYRGKFYLLLLNAYNHILSLFDLKYTILSDIHKKLIAEVSILKEDEASANKLFDLAYSEMRVFHDTSKAKMHYNRALDIGKNLSNHRIIGIACVGLAEVKRQEDPTMVKSFYLQAFEEFRKLEDKDEILLCLGRGGSKITDVLQVYLSNTNKETAELLGPEFILKIISGESLN